MRTALIEIELLEPALIAGRKISYYYETTTYISAQTLRGAILARLILDGVVSAEKPYDTELYTTSALPVMGNSNVTITHAATLHLDCEEGDFVLELDLASMPVNKIDDVVNMLINGVGKAGCGVRKVRYEGGAVVTIRSTMRLGDGLIIHKVDRVKVDTMSMVGIEIDPVFKRAAAGKIYVYNAIKPGTRFRALVFGNEELIERVKDMEIAIGRGSRRGLGRARVKFIREVTNLGRSRVFMALSPIDTTYIGNTGLTLAAGDVSVETWITKMGSKGLTQERVKWGMLLNLGSIIIMNEELTLEDYVKKNLDPLKQGLNVALPTPTMESLAGVIT